MSGVLNLTVALDDRITVQVGDRLVAQHLLVTRSPPSRTQLSVLLPRCVAVFVRMLDFLSPWLGSKMIRSSGYFTVAWICAEPYGWGSYRPS